MEQKYLRTTVNTLSFVGICVTIVLCVVGYRMQLFTSTEALGSFLGSVGIWGPVIFMIMQIIQVVIPIIPGGISCAAGVILFGPWYGFWYNYVSICIGSVINFLLVKRYGKPFMESVVSKTTMEKYIGWLDQGERFDKLFAAAIFCPVAPDDFLCMLAGLTKMKLKRFVTIIILGKPFAIVAYSIGLAKIIGMLMSLKF